MADRHQFRANWHSYNDGLYFVTVCTDRMKFDFGLIAEDEMVLSRLGKVLDYWLNKAPESYKGICVVNYVIMPNHFHCLVDIRDEAGWTPSINHGCLRKTNRKDREPDFHHNSLLARFIGNIKRAVKAEANKAGLDFAWQRSYHEHIVKHESAFIAIMQYIDRNVSTWAEDRFYR